MLNQSNAAGCVLRICSNRYHASIWCPQLPGVQAVSRKVQCSIAFCLVHCLYTHCMHTHMHVPTWHVTLNTETNQRKVPSVPAQLWQKTQRASEGQLSGMFAEAVFDNSAFPCSYLYTGGKLTSVPASRAAVFKDRSLSPMDKRLLTRFLMQLGSSMHGNPFPQVHKPAAQLQYELLTCATGSDWIATTK